MSLSTNPLICRQTELARKAGFQQRQISVIETGYASAKLRTLLALAAALNLDLRLVPRSTDDWIIQ